MAFLRSGRGDLSAVLNIDDLGIVVEPGNERWVAQSSADDQSSIYDAAGEFREQALVWRINAAPLFCVHVVESPLSAVRVPGQGEFDRRRDFGDILGMVHEEDVIAVRIGKIPQPTNLRHRCIMMPPYFGVRFRGGYFPLLERGMVSGREAPNDFLFPVYLKRSIVIIQKRYAGRADELYILPGEI